MESEKITPQELNDLELGFCPYCEAAGRGVGNIARTGKHELTCSECGAIFAA